MDSLEIEKEELLASYRSQAGPSHEKYRADRDYKPRNKPLKPEDKEWMAANPTKGGTENRNGKNIPVVDIAALKFDELPPSRQEDTHASFRIAIEAVYRAVKSGTPTDETFINATADTIHEQWLMRNGEDTYEEIADLAKDRGYVTVETAADKDAEIANRLDQLKIYTKMTDENKELDRKFVREILQVYKDKHPE